MMVIGIDAHKRSHTAVTIDENGRQGSTKTVGTTTQKLVEGRGWRYEVWSEPPAAELHNIRFLAGFRNPRCFDDELLESIRQHQLVGRTLGEALSADFGRPPALVRSAVFHVIWNQYLTIDLAEPLTRSTILTKGPRS